MGKCWKCGHDVFLKEEETRCDYCKEIVRYWCWNCKTPFDVSDGKKKKPECGWCHFFKCPSCGLCGETCEKKVHFDKVRKIIQKDSSIQIHQWGDIDNKSKEVCNYFEDVKNGKVITCCAFKVNRSYAKDKIKGILAKIKIKQGVKSETDRQAFESRLIAIQDADIGEELTPRNLRKDGTYGQEERDILNLCVCLGLLKVKTKSIHNKKGKKIGEYDLWERIEDVGICKFFDQTNLVSMACPNCDYSGKVGEVFCPKCVYEKKGKIHNKGDRFELKQRIANNPTCKNLSNFKERYPNGRNN
jgi:hypothetical protein